MRISAGIVLYQFVDDALCVLLVYPGGPYQKKDETGRWSIPKGEVDVGENLLGCAIREFGEETGHAVPEDAELIPLGRIRQKGGKVVHAWGFAGRWTPEAFRSNTYMQEWPPKSGRIVEFPEAAKAELMPLPRAREMIKETQVPLLDRLVDALDGL